MCESIHFASRIYESKFRKSQYLFTPAAIKWRTETNRIREIRMAKKVSEVSWASRVHISL